MPIETAARDIKIKYPEIGLAVLDAWWVTAGNLLPKDTFEVWNGLGHGRLKGGRGVGRGNYPGEHTGRSEGGGPMRMLGLPLVCDKDAGTTKSDSSL